MTINKASIIDEIHKKLGGTKAQAEEVMDLILDLITKALKEGGEVSIAGLGIFSTKLRVARQARNPRTGEMVQVPAMKVPKFRPAKALKEMVK
jgi:DNA-binding protein HU-beta